jgi:protein subunit release factor A
MASKNGRSVAEASEDRMQEFREQLEGARAVLARHQEQEMTPLREEKIARIEAQVERLEKECGE